MIRSFDILTRRRCGDLTQAELLDRALEWLVVMSPTAGDDGFYKQIPHIRIDGKGTPGMAILVKRTRLET